VVGKHDQSRKQPNKNRAKAKTQAGSKPKEKGKAAKPEPGKGKTKPGKKATKAARDKKLSALDAAAKLLEASGEAMTCQEMIKAMAEKKLWSSPGGRTPQATLYAALLREISNKGKESRFRKAGPGKFDSAKRK
jgi:HB1, ASXL, restriction endonuclease HTH domain